MEQRNQIKKVVDEAVSRSLPAFLEYSKASLQKRRELLFAISSQLHLNGHELIRLAMQETNLEESRLKVELKRTRWQLESYGEATVEGLWMDISIDHGFTEQGMKKPDLRKTMVPLGPVVVFGASNFPFAYSTAGGDTASALAAGCSVIVKGHPAHRKTSAWVANCIQNALQSCSLPKDLFIHLMDDSFLLGQELVLHPQVSAVGFTGSREGGMALYGLTRQRKTPIPFFAEMGSINPVFILSSKLHEKDRELINLLFSSMTQSVGQFCTQPGVLILQEGKKADVFIQELGEMMKECSPKKMLHPGIAGSFHTKRKAVMEQEGVNKVASADHLASSGESIPTLVRTTAKKFLSNQLLQQEVFGPYTLAVTCDGFSEMKEVAMELEGQLTATLHSTINDEEETRQLLDVLRMKAGRIIINGVPTGVEVIHSMHHGGPYPATTDPRFTSVGSDAMRRFSRAVTFQNSPNDWLPEELKNENPLQIWRKVNGSWTKGCL